MRSLRILTTLVLFSVVLAGCSGPPSDADADALAQAEAAAAALEVKATATTGVIRGVVVDEALRPLTGALVVLQNAKQNTSTNEGGAFAFEGLEAGTYFLAASLLDYTSVQQSAEVVAGVDDPEPIKILLAAIPRATPLVVGYQATIFVDSSVIVLGTGYTLGGVTTDNSFSFELAIDPNSTVVQTEITWDPTTPLGESSRINGGTYVGDDGVDTEAKMGTSPMIFRANGTTAKQTADTVYYRIFVGDSSGLPGGMHANQQFDCFIHVFYNFQPRDDWQFGRDGEHPLPP